MSTAYVCGSGTGVPGGVKPWGWEGNWELLSGYVNWAKVVRDQLSIRPGPDLKRMAARHDTRFISRRGGM